ncbi:TLC domain-containing protein 3A isoform X1 [Tribolium madens]|uniref:TLC domain-containing protein 3A isoform X1 n=1 Tax=Tribolium madens TaxID=41895 RepID=UPI001CF7384A|nr:TLC domain-containing protein 3A isoform X1 [Tribolium madens]
MKSKVQLISQIKKEHRKTHMHIPLIFVLLSTLVLSVLSVSDLDWEAKISIKRGFSLFCYGLVFFTVLYIVSNNLMLRTSLGQKFVKTYKLSVADVYDISNKQVSAVQALFCCITGVTSCTYSCTRDMLHTSHYISEAYAWFGAAYFFYDIWSMYKVHNAKIVQVSMNGDGKRSGVNFFSYLQTHAVIVGHHIFIGGFGFLVITYLRGGLGDCFFGFVYLMEASTPFVSLRGILSKIGMKSSILYVINGLVMLGTFFVCRVAMFPYVIYLYARSVDLDYFSAIRSLPTGCKVSIVTLLLPQVYWFLLMVKGASQVLKGKVTKKKTLKMH